MGFREVKEKSRAIKTSVLPDILFDFTAIGSYNNYLKPTSFVSQSIGIARCTKHAAAFLLNYLGATLFANTIQIVQTPA